MYILISIVDFSYWCVWTSEICLFVFDLTFSTGYSFPMILEAGQKNTTEIYGVVALVNQVLLIWMQKIIDR
jgi:hypothetical protein